MEANVALPPTFRRRQYNWTPLSFGYSLALHVLMVALLGTLWVQGGMPAPAGGMQAIAIGLFALGQPGGGAASAATTLRDPNGSAAPSATRMGDQPAPQQQASARTSESAGPPIIDIDNPLSPFALAGGNRQQDALGTRQQQLGERQSGGGVATGTTLGTGGNLPVRDAPAVGNVGGSGSGPGSVPNFVPGNVPTDITGYVGRGQRNGLPGQGGGIGTGRITNATRRLLESPLPPVPRELEQAGVHPEISYKVLINPAGSIAEVSVYKRSGWPSLDNEVATYIRRWRYEAILGANEWRIIKVNYAL
ncbi:MAG TPA: TonB family protein, partial [bacterium]|nr:TonB family protein [bacterium]